MQHVQAAKGRNRRRDGVGDAGPVGDIGFHEQRVADAITGRRLGQVGGFGAKGAVDLGDHHFGALFGETQGGGAADAAAAAGDKGDFPRQTCHDLLSGCTCFRQAGAPLAIVAAAMIRSDGAGIRQADVHDPEAYEKYKQAAPQYVARHGGEYW